MDWADQKEVFDIIHRLGPVVLSTVTVQTSAAAAGMRRGIGMMMDDPNMTHPATFAIAMRVCLDMARLAGATLEAMGTVRLAALAENPVSLAGISTVQTTVRLSLAQEARLVTGLKFVSRDDASALAAKMGAAFDQAAEAASDDLDAASYMAIIGLQSAMIKYLTDLGRQLPRIVPYTLPTLLPALTMSQRFYGTGSRSDEIRLENKVVHPLFVPAEGKVLAV